MAVLLLARARRSRLVGPIGADIHFGQNGNSLIDFSARSDQINSSHK